MLIEILLNGLTWQMFVADFIFANAGAYLSIRFDIKNGAMDCPTSPPHISWAYFFQQRHNIGRLIQLQIAIAVSIIIGNGLSEVPVINKMTPGAPMSIPVAFAIGVGIDRAIIAWQRRNKQPYGSVRRKK